MYERINVYVRVIVGNSWAKKYLDDKVYVFYQRPTLKYYIRGLPIVLPIVKCTIVCLHYYYYRGVRQ